jgi:tetratricopeptide (TPR) repeat protein
MGQYESAIAMYQSLLVLDPKYAFGYVLIAEAQFDLGMYDEVISSLNQSILNRPQYAQAYFELAELYRELGEFEKAREACQSAEEADKTTSVGLYQLALVENAATNNPEALRLIEQALKMPDANFSWLYKIQGDIYVDLGQYEKATSSYEKALEQGSKTAYNGKGHLQLLLGQLGEAEGSFIQATKFLPANPRPRLNLAILYGITGRQDLANTLFSEVISVFPSTQRPSRVLTRIKAMVGLRSFEEALRTLSDLRSKVPNLSRRANDFWHDLELMSRIPTIQVGAKKFSQDARRILGTDRIE